jgi:hypothetical protein
MSHLVFEVFRLPSCSEAGIDHVFFPFIPPSLSLSLPFLPHLPFFGADPSQTQGYLEKRSSMSFRVG